MIERILDKYYMKNDNEDIYNIEYEDSIKNKSDYD